MNYYKILNRNEKHNSMQYRTGLNVNCEPFYPFGSCTCGGMYFSREDILAFLNYGPWIRQVTLCQDSEIYKDSSYDPIKWKTDKFILGKKRKITIRVVKELIEEGANIHADSDYALRWASEKNHLGIVKLLVKNGADIHVRGEDPLRLSCFYGNSKIVKYLINKGANVHVLNETPLKYASSNGHLEVVELLVKNGADVHSGDCNSLPFYLRCFGGEKHNCYIKDIPLLLALYNGQLEIVKFLIQYDYVINKDIILELATKMDLVDVVVKYFEKYKKNREN